MDLDVSVVIVSYNTRNLLRECLSALFSSLSLPLPLPLPDEPHLLSSEVWVVDNASADKSAEMVAAEFPQVRLIANDTNVGFATANNQALIQSNGRFVLLLNPDTIVLDDAIGQLVVFMESNQSAGAAGPKLLNPDRTLQHSAFHFPSLLMSFLDFFPINHRLANSRLNGRYPSQNYDGLPFPIDHPLGACFIVRRAAAAEVGWMDHEFFMYCEEVDWSLRLKRSGWSIYCVPQARVIHYGGQSTNQFRGEMLVELHRARRQLFCKHYSPRYQWASRQIVRIGVARDAFRAWRFVRSGKITRLEFSERMATYRTIFRL